MKVFITKYALTDGIQECDVLAGTRTGMIYVSDDSTGRYFHGEGREWHLTMESAIERAEEMRLKKIESLNRKIKELNEMDFRKGNK